MPYFMKNESRVTDVSRHIILYETEDTKTPIIMLSDPNKDEADSIILDDEGFSKVWDALKSIIKLEKRQKE